MLISKCEVRTAQSRIVGEVGVGGVGLEMKGKGCICIQLHWVFNILPVGVANFWTIYISHLSRVSFFLLPAVFLYQYQVKYLQLSPLPGGLVSTFTFQVKKFYSRAHDSENSEIEAVRASCLSRSRPLL